MKQHLRSATLRRPSLFAALISLTLTGTAFAQDPVPVADDPIRARIENGAMIIDVDGNGVVEVAPTPGGPWVPLHEALPGARLEAPIPIDAQRRFVRQRRPDGNASLVRPLIPGLPEEPPRFSSVVARGFDGEKVIVEAVLAPGQVVPVLLPFFIGNDLVLLRDDGLEGDAVARDGRFHGLVPVPMLEIERARGIMAAQPGDARIDDFDGGRAVKPQVVLAAALVARFDDFLAGRPVPLPIPIGFPPVIGPQPAPIPLPPPPPGIPPITPCNQLPTWQKTLLITDLTVVEDPVRTFDPCAGKGTPMGAWTFGRLMSDMANQPVSGVSPSDFARRWLRSWEFDQMINNDSVPNRKPRMLATILKSWQDASGGPDKPLDMAMAPFRLVAIVNRLDLRGNITYGGGNTNDPCCGGHTCISGEGRFVFCFCGDSAGNGGGYPGQPGGDGGLVGGGPERPFLVIFEYCIPKDTCPELHAYAQQWANLQCIPFGPVYNGALQRITDQFALANSAPQKPNGSALNQLRTNENLLTPPKTVPPTQWELREFKIFCDDSDAGHLRPVTVKQTPREDVDATPLLQNFITTTIPAPPNHKVPLEWGMFPGGPQQPFLGGRAVMPPISITSGSPAWATTGASVPNMLRHDFALNTCNGCHSTETNTPFVHIGCRAPGQVAPLSGFLIGDGSGGPFLVNIPGAPAATVGFFDLRRREKDLIQFLLTPCGLIVFDVTPLDAAAVH